MFERGETKAILFSIALFALLWLLLKTDFIDSLILLVLLGLIPGTNLMIPTWLMSIIAIVTAIFLLGWLRSQPLYIGNLAEQERTARKLARIRVAKKTAQNLSSANDKPTKTRRYRRATIPQ